MRMASLILVCGFLSACSAMHPAAPQVTTATSADSPRAESSTQVPLKPARWGMAWDIPNGATHTFPITTDTPSANGKYLARITPSKSHYDEKLKDVVNDAPTHLHVFAVQGDKRLPLWECDLKNLVGPNQVRVADDGASVVTVDDWFWPGYGDLVVAVYCKNGLLKNYSLEDVLGIDEERMHELGMPIIVGSASYREWRWGSLDFFDISEDGRRFCLWVNFPARWLAWDLDTGKMVTPDGKLQNRWNALARTMSIEALKKADEDLDRDAIIFLGQLRRTEDRTLLEQQLSSKTFSAGRSYYGGQKEPKETSFPIDSVLRNRADLVLSKWDNKEPFKTDGSKFDDEHKYHLLGTVKGVIRLPEPKEEGTLWLYLVPESEGPDGWAKASNTHVAQIKAWSSSSKMPKDVVFHWKGVTPGKYWVKAAYMKDPEQTPGPGTADLETKERRAFEVYKEKETDAGILNCVPIIKTATAPASSCRR